MKKILVQPGKKKEIAQKLDTSYPTIRTALNGYCSSLLSVKIRKLALELGGEYESDEY